jgi:hypothetical protein
MNSQLEENPQQSAATSENPQEWNDILIRREIFSKDFQGRGSGFRFRIATFGDKLSRAFVDIRTLQFKSPSRLFLRQREIDFIINALTRQGPLEKIETNEETCNTRVFKITFHNFNGLSYAMIEQTTENGLSHKLKVSEVFQSQFIQVLQELKDMFSLCDRVKESECYNEILQYAINKCKNTYTENWERVVDDVIIFILGVKMCHKEALERVSVHPGNGGKASQDVLDLVDKIVGYLNNMVDRKKEASKRRKSLCK